MLDLIVLLAAILLPLSPALEAGGAGEPASRTAMTVVPAGSYTPLYAPSGDVAVPSFRLDRTPVTRAQFAAFVAAEPAWRRDRVPAVFADAAYLRDWIAPDRPGGDALAPVTGVSWFAARAYCGWAGGRLPTAHEWEYAARADETRADASADVAFRARLLELYTSRPGTPPAVGSVFTNIHGVADLHGLVWEWVADFNTVVVPDDSRAAGDRDANLYCAASAEAASTVGDYAAFLRHAFRASLRGSSASGALGFRCAADL